MTEHSGKERDVPQDPGDVYTGPLAQELHSSLVKLNEANKALYAHILGPERLTAIAAYTAEAELINAGIGDEAFLASKAIDEAERERAYDEEYKATSDEVKAMDAWLRVWNEQDFRDGSRRPQAHLDAERLHLRALHLLEHELAGPLPGGFTGPIVLDTEQFDFTVDEYSVNFRHTEQFDDGRKIITMS